MKILLVSTQDYIHHPIPSRHHYIFEILAERHDIHVAHFHVNNSDKELKTKLTVEEATIFPLKNPLLHYTANAPYHFWRFDEIIRDGNFDVVIASNILAGTAVIHEAHKYGVPVIFDLKDWFPDSAAAYIENPHLKEIVRQSVWQITKHNLSKSDKITTVSPSLVSKLKSLGFESELITNGVDTDLFKFHTKDYYLKSRNPFVDSDTITEKDFVIGFVGSIERWYAIDDLIKMMPVLIQKYEHTKLLIVGGSLFTEYGKELKSLITRLGLEDNVTILGTRPYEQLPRYIAAMDVCTIPLDPPEWRKIALPNKFFEYTACGKPILTTPIPDVQAMGTNNLYIYNNMYEYANLIEKIRVSPNISSNNVEQFSWKSKAAEFETLINKVTKK